MSRPMCHYGKACDRATKERVLDVIRIADQAFAKI